MPPELTEGQIAVQAVDLADEVKKATGHLSPADRYRVLRAVADRIDDYLDTQADPDDEDDEDTATPEPGNPVG